MTANQTPAAATARAILNKARERETEDLYRFLSAAIKEAADLCCTRMNLTWHIERHPDGYILDTKSEPLIADTRIAKIYNSRSFNLNVLEQRLAEDDFTLEFTNHPSLGLVIDYIIWEQVE